MPALTRDEARTRAHALDVHHYDIALDLTGEDHFTTRTTVTFSARTPTPTTTFIELQPTQLHTATLDGHPLDPSTLHGNRLPLPDLTPGEHHLRIEATMRYSRTGEGMHRFTDPADGRTYLYTHLFLDNAQRVFPCFDQPDLKATFALTITAPDDWIVLGNSRATPHPNGRWTLPRTPRISTYLVAIAAGPWHSIHTEHAGLPFGLHCRRSLAPHLNSDTDELLDITRRCYDHFHQIFDEPYPFDSYDQAFVPEFNPGAMENPGLVTLRDEFLYRSAVTATERQTRGVVIAHEMAHMWFGNLVTLTWWDDIWLNESFAEYMGYHVLNEATHFTDTWTDFGIARKSWGYDADQRPSTHPVAPQPDDVPDTASALVNFDGISYAKGASALRQLVAWMGEKDFLAGINHHFTRHRFSNAALADFLESLAHTTHRDIHAWADSWLRTTGVDTLTPTAADTTDGWTLTVTHDGTRPHHLTIGLYDHDPATPGRLVPRPALTHDTSTDTPHTAPGHRPALILLNDTDLTYAKVRLDPASWTTLDHALSDLSEPLSRAVAWNAARDMVRDAELPPTAYLEAARTHLPYETDIAIVQGVLRFARGQIADRYLPTDERSAALATLSSLSRDILRRTEGSENGDGKGLRLAAVRTFIDSATTPDGIQDWLDGDSVPGGPTLDPELRWRILARLAALDAITPDTIDAELTRDPSASGQEGAARCRAALPDPERKEAAWQAMFPPNGSTTEISNRLFTATATGFWTPEHLELVRPYATRYFPDAVHLAHRRGPALAESAGRHAFPTPLVDEDTCRLTETCLHTADPTPPLHRQLTDHLSDLRRALTIRTTHTTSTGAR